MQPLTCNSSSGGGGGGGGGSARSRSKRGPGLVLDCSLFDCFYVRWKHRLGLAVRFLSINREFIDIFLSLSFFLFLSLFFFFAAAAAAAESPVAPATNTRPSTLMAVYRQLYPAPLPSLSSVVSFQQKCENQIFVGNRHKRLPFKTCLQFQIIATAQLFTFSFHSFIYLSSR